MVPDDIKELVPLKTPRKNSPAQGAEGEIEYKTVSKAGNTHGQYTVLPHLKLNMTKIHSFTYQISKA